MEAAIENIVLFKRMVFADHLNYEEACNLLDKACRTKANKFIAFTICTNGIGGWRLEGDSRELSKLFLKSPLDFVIARD